MRIEYLAAIAIVAVAAGAGLAVHSVGSLPPEKQSTPAATQLATLLAESSWIRFCIGPVANVRDDEGPHGGDTLPHQNASKSSRCLLPSLMQRIQKCQTSQPGSLPM